MGLERTSFLVMENVGVVEVCVNVSFPVIDCPIAFPFDVVLSTDDGTAGNMPVLAICSNHIFNNSLYNGLWTTE